MHIVRGAHTKLPAVPSAASCRPTVSGLQTFPARGAAILCRKRASINWLASQVRGLSVQSPNVGVAPLGHLPPSWNRCAAQSSPVHCAAATVPASSRHCCARLSPTSCSKNSDLVLVWALRSGERLCRAKSQGASVVQNSMVPVGRTGGSRPTNRCCARAACGTWYARRWPSSIKCP